MQGFERMEMERLYYWFTPMAYVRNGFVYAMNNMPIGRYNGSKLYDMSGNYLGYGNQGFRGLLGSIFFLLLLRRLFRRRRVI